MAFIAQKFSWNLASPLSELCGTPWEPLLGGHGKPFMLTIVPRKPLGRFVGLTPVLHSGCPNQQHQSDSLSMWQVFIDNKDHFPRGPVIFSRGYDVFWVIVWHTDGSVPCVLALLHFGGPQLLSGLSTSSFSLGWEEHCVRTWETLGESFPLQSHAQTRVAVFLGPVTQAWLPSEATAALSVAGVCKGDLSSFYFWPFFVLTFKESIW